MADWYARNLLLENSQYLRGAWTRIDSRNCVLFARGEIQAQLGTKFAPGKFYHATTQQEDLEDSQDILKLRTIRDLMMLPSFSTSVTFMSLTARSCADTVRLDLTRMIGFVNFTISQCCFILKPQSARVLSRYIWQPLCSLFFLT